jgi:hypothetical protein
MSEPMLAVGKLLIAMGLLIVAAGAVMVLLGRWGLPVGLPGDLVIRRPGLTVYVPITTALLLSVVLSLLLSLLAALRR